MLGVVVSGRRVRRHVGCVVWLLLLVMDGSPSRACVAPY